MKQSGGSDEALTVHLAKAHGEQHNQHAEGPQHERSVHDGVLVWQLVLLLWQPRSALVCCCRAVVCTPLQTLARGASLLPLYFPKIYTLPIPSFFKHGMD